jgi:hypothetical protein
MEQTEVKGRNGEKLDQRTQTTYASIPNTGIRQ